MADILHDFTFRAMPERVYEMVSTAFGLDRWWTKRSKGEPSGGPEYVLWFGPAYDWRARGCVGCPGKTLRARDDTRRR